MRDRPTPILTGESARRFHEIAKANEERAKNPTPEMIAEAKRMRDIWDRYTNTKWEALLEFADTCITPEGNIDRKLFIERGKVYFEIGLIKRVPKP